MKFSQATLEKFSSTDFLWRKRAIKGRLLPLAACQRRVLKTRDMIGFASTKDVQNVILFCTLLAEMCQCFRVKILNFLDELDQALV